MSPTFRGAQTPSFSSGSQLPQPLQPLQQTSTNLRSASPELRRLSSPQRSPVASSPPQQQPIKPTIFAQQSQSDWRYFLNKYAYITKRFFAELYERPQDLSQRVQEIRQRRPHTKVWVLVESVKDMERLQKDIKDQKDLKFVVFDISYSRPTQLDNLVLGSDHRH